MKRYGQHAELQAATNDEKAEIKWLKKELKRDTEERDILKTPAVYFASHSE